MYIICDTDKECNRIKEYCSSLKNKIQYLLVKCISSYEIFINDGINIEIPYDRFYRVFLKNEEYITFNTEKEYIYQYYTE